MRVRERIWTDALSARVQVRMVAAALFLLIAGLGIGLLLGLPISMLSLAALTVALCAQSMWCSAARSERTELVRSHNELVEKAALFSWEIDVQSGEILAMAGNIEGVLGYTAAELVGRHVGTIVNIADARDVLREELERRSRTEINAVVTAKHRDGTEVTLRELRLPTNREGVVRGVSIDITALARATEALRYQAQHDALTGLANRVLVEKVATAELGKADGQCVLVAMADLDRFKEVNDTLGHPAGDRLLRVLANRLSNNLSEMAVVGRLGGDEFAFVFIGDVNPAKARALGTRVHELLTQPVAIDGLQLGVGCSVGVAYSPTHGRTYEELLKCADVATYQAKQSSGVVVFESVSENLSTRSLQLTAEAPAALDRGEFELFFQPQIDLTTGAIIGVEGLARWQHPQFGLLLPGAFFDVIEVGPLYHRFTNEMIRQAVAFAAATIAAGTPLQVAVNVGSMSFIDQHFVEVVASLLKSHQVPASMITIEILETDLFDEARGAVVFDELTKLGVRLSIDDFGTGYSTFGRLKSLAVQDVKIDRSFVQGLGESTKDAILVEASVRLSHLLGHDVVAEGVETKEQMQMLQRFGCGKAQGFLWSPAIHRSELLELLGRGISYDVQEPKAPAPNGWQLDIEVTDSLLEATSDRAAIQAVQRLLDNVSSLHPRAGIVVKDRAGRIVDANANFRGSIGNDRFRDLIGLRDENFASGADASLHAAEDFTISNHGAVATQRVDVITIRGRQMQTVTSVAPLSDVVSRPIGSVHIISPA